MQYSFEDASPLPSLKAPMTRLIGRIPRRQIVPRRTGAQHPQHAVQHGARVGPRPPTTIGSPSRLKQRFEDGPLRVSQVHAAEYNGDRHSFTTRFGVYEIGSSVPNQKYVAKFLAARRPEGKARRPRIFSIFKGGATPPSGMPRPKNGDVFLIRDTSSDLPPAVASIGDVWLTARFDRFVAGIVT